MSIFKEPMTFQPGKANEKTKVLIESQDKVLELIRTGYTPNAAMAAIGRKGDTLRIWRMRDDLFAKKLDDAVVDGQKYSFEALGLDKATVPFDKFSEMFFGQRVFPHQQSWIDLLEGREPSYLPEGVKYSPGQANRLLINVPPEHCATLDTPVFTGNRGWTTIGDITEDDTLIAPDGVATKVIEIWRPETEVDVYEVKFSDGEVIKTDGGHKWNVYPVHASRKRRSEQIEITTAQLINEPGNFRIPVSNGYSWSPDVELPVDPYLFGYWLGDGGYDKSCFAVGFEDIVAFEKQLESLGLSYKVSLDSRKRSHVVYVHGLRSALRSTGEFGNIDRSIPTQYFLGSRDQRIALLQGLMDSDGTITVKDSRARFVQHKERMVRDVYRLAASLGLKPHLKNYGEAWEVGFRTTDFNIFRLERKFSRQKPFNATSKSNSRVIVSVTPAGKAMVQCVTVPSDSNEYLIGNSFISTRNAKSTVVTVNYSTYRIALDPNIRIIVVSKTLVKAREFVYAIKGRLSHPRYLKLQTAYGPKGGWKEDADTWRADTVYLGSDARDSSEKDPTIQALGIGGQIYGARADLIILDDVVTGANAHEWQKHIDWIQKEVITRLGKNGKLLILGTRIAANDLYRELRNNKHWSSGKSPFTYMGMPAVLSFDGKPSEWKTLWPKSDRPWEGDEDEEPDEEGLYVKWDGPTLHTRRGEVSPSVWALVYQQEDIAEDAIFPAELVVGSTNISRRFGPLRAGERGHPERVVGYTIIGFDPAMVGNAAFVVINYNRSDGKIYVLDCVNMTDPNPQKIRATMEALVIKYRPQEMRIETNAHQKSYALDTELRQWLATYGVRLEGHNTGKIKWDVDYGVASMSGLLGSMQNEKHQKNNILEFPSVEMSEGLKALREQLIIWRPGTREKTDCVMALWFGVIRAREMQQASTRMSHYGSNRWATRAQQTQRVSVNLDEMYNEQWEQEFAEVM